MRFGIFGGAKVGTGVADSGLAGDSIGLDDYIDYVMSAEECGFSSSFVVEHHFTGTNQVSSSLTLLTYLAARTSRIRLGTAVVVLPWHNPALLAEQIATIDLLSRGRFDFGIGRGYRPVEFEGFGIPLGEAQARFDETLEFLRQAWTSPGRFSRQGHHWTFKDVVIEPRPVQQPHPPIWLAGGSPESIRRAARENLNLLIDQVAPVETVLKRVSLYRQEKEAAGHAFLPEQVAVTRGFHLAGTEEDGEARLIAHASALDRVGALKLGGLSGQEGARAYAASDAALIGTSQRIIERIERLQKGGVGTVLLADIHGSPENLRAFSRAVMPSFRFDQAA